MTRSWFDVLRCALGYHQHAVALRGVIRCTCGAIGPAPWFYRTQHESLNKWRPKASPLTDLEGWKKEMEER